jgi:Ca2+-binding EF-hand superfamily protein
MVMKKTAGVLVALFVVGASAPVLAQGSPKTSRAKTGAPDPKQSSEPSRASASSEARTASAPELLFAAADRNGDGTVSYDEFASIARESVVRRVTARFHQLDRNHDGRVTRDEVNKMSRARFARFDLDHDGAFTIAELGIAMTRELEGELPQIYARLDIDHDGRFTVAELTPHKSASPAPATRVATAAPQSKPVTKSAVVAQRGPSSVQ